MTTITKALAKGTIATVAAGARAMASAAPAQAQWLAPEEGEQLVFQFEAEVERLLKAA